MIHTYASEFIAFLVAVVLCFTYFYVKPLYLGSDLSFTDNVIMICTSLAACRFMAQGEKCKWPAGVDFSGRVALVTGSSSGVGYGVAEELALHGWTVILAGPDSKRLLTAKEKILRKVARKYRKVDKKDQPQVIVLGTVDLSSEQSVRDYAQCVNHVRHKYPLALLVNAAGTLSRHLDYGKDGFENIEKMVATNAVGPLLLSELLLPALEHCADLSGVSSRIVNVASSCHTFLGFPKKPYKELDYPLQMLYGTERSSPHYNTHRHSTVSAEKADSCTPFLLEDLPPLNFVGYYGLSKLCVVWNTRILAQKVSNLYFSPTAEIENADDESNEGKTTGRGTQQHLKVFVACCHPGIITTHLYRDLFPNWVLDYIIYYPSLLVGKTWREGAQAALKPAVETSTMIHGGYYLCSGEYGADSGVSCVSSYGSNMVLAMGYYQWVKELLSKN
ncbi:short-chain dehydrogenase [Angomonas deanei]|nr:short-chain dehydrogenase [Angomonas deanei]|eukprot:EPY38869.1 short-chain dehydrogenase [Angomonas deanei]